VGLRREPDRDPVVLAAATCIWGVLFLLPWLAGEALTSRARLDLGSGAVAALVYLALAGSALTLLLWTYGAARVPASTPGVLTASIPAVGYMCAVLAGEPAVGSRRSEAVWRSSAQQSRPRPRRP
jgi:drug/metabolite transporter (DMT)-like permease